MLLTFTIPQEEWTNGTIAVPALSGSHGSCRVQSRLCRKLVRLTSLLSTAITSARPSELFASSAEGTFPSRAPVLDMASFAFAREARYTLVAVFSSAEAISLTSVPEVVSCVGLRCYRQAIPPLPSLEWPLRPSVFFFDGGSKSTIRAKPT